MNAKIAHSNNNTDHPLTVIGPLLLEPVSNDILIP